ncbi:MAG: P27 family phage terminase small subunit [Gammaproteobacteria bacterium]|nr:P27 family phage terminase small subunit [Gammaproteobacteria bacterium]
MRRALPKPPAHLQKPGADLWKIIVADYEIVDSGGLALLTTACECLDRMRQAQAAIKKHGALIKDRYGCLKSNPACVLERDSRNGYLQSLKALQLDVAGDKLPGRPQGS